MKEIYVQYSTRRKNFHYFGSGKERTSYLLTHVICMKRIAVDFGRGGARAFFVNFPLSFSPFFARALTLSFQEKGFFFFPLQQQGILAAETPKGKRQHFGGGGGWLSLATNLFLLPPLATALHRAGPCLACLRKAFFPAMRHRSTIAR